MKAHRDGKRVILSSNFKNIRIFTYALGKSCKDSLLELDLPSQMGVRLELDSDKRFQPWGISVVDETMNLPLQGEARQELKRVLQEPGQEQLLVEQETLHAGKEIALDEQELLVLTAAKPPFSLL